MGPERILVLICEDKKGNRDIYSRGVLRVPGLGVMTVDHPMYVMDTLRANPKIGVILMDLEFPLEPGSKRRAVMGQKYLPQIREQFPRVKIVVVTQLGPSVYKVVLECDAKRLHDAWIDVGKEIKEEEIAARIEPLVYPLYDVSKNGLWILHLSDLHFGSTTPFPFWGLAEDGALFAMLKKDIMENARRQFPEIGRCPDLLLITGDLTDKATDEQFEKVEEFIRQLALGCLSTGSFDTEGGLDRVVIVPGNHEVNFDISRARSIEKQGDSLHVKILNKEDDVPLELRYLKKYIWAPFERFCYRLRLVPPSFAELWRKDEFFSAGIWRYPEFSIMIYGLNTAAYSVDYFSKTPKVDSSVINKLEKWSIDPSNEVELILPRILMAHHSLGSGASGTERINDKEVGALRKAIWSHLKAKIVLTGHTHEEVAERIDVDGKAILFIGAGSAAVADKERPEREPLHYNLINIRPRGVVDDSQEIVTIYSRVSFKEDFVTNPNSPRLQFFWDEKSGWVKM